jgi:hypothetical protein
MDHTMDLTPQVGDLQNWVPVRIYHTAAGPFVDWCYMGNDRFTHSFFDVTITKRLYDPFSLLFRHKTPIHFMERIAREADCLAPTGFIFHMSRCGSTLVSQMLAALDRNIAISEPSPIDAVLRANSRDPSITVKQRSDWLRWIVAALGRRRNDVESGYFIKFDSWTTIDMALILDTFPDVPWIFLYRDPLEVIVSHARQPGVQMIPGSIDRLLPGLPVMEMLQMPAAEYCARVVARFSEIALRYSESGKGILIEYTELPGAVTGVIADHFGISFSPGEIEKMNALTTFDAKTPGLTFAPDSRDKQGSATELARTAAAELAYPLYEQLRTRQKEMAS